MSPLAIFFAFWFWGMLLQGHRMLQRVPDPIRELFRVAPKLMFTSFVVVLFLIWPLWMAWDIWNRIREVWCKWVIRRSMKALEAELKEIQDEPKP